MKVKVEILRSKYDGKTLAVSIDDVRVGPDLGPWTVIAGPFSADHVPVVQPVDPEKLARALADDADWDGIPESGPSMDKFVLMIRRALKRW